MLAIIGLGTRCAPSENDSFEIKTALGAFAPHLVVEKLRKKRLEHEGGRRGKSRQQGRGGIEDRPSADVVANRAVEYCLARGRAAQDGDEPAAGLELAAGRNRRDLGRPVEEDDVVGSGSLPPLRERAGRD